MLTWAWKTAKQGGFAVTYDRSTADKWDNIVSVDWLAKRLGSDDVVIADCRFELADPTAGRRAYDEAHIPGAIYFDLDQDLSSPARGPGGRHPLPPVEQTVALFGRAGIGDGVKVVCYDAQRGMIAARLWWMLRYLGHREVALLDGGYDAWLAAGHPVSAEVTVPTPRIFVPRLQSDMIATQDEVRAITAETEPTATVLIDARAPERYRGEVEPLDPVAGHIPGAVNVPWEAHVDGSGRFLSPAALAEQYAGVIDNATDTIVHCGSGVSGCVNILGLEQAGRPGARLYVGGWSDWCSDPANRVATGPEPGDTGSAGSTS